MKNKYHAREVVAELYLMGKSPSELSKDYAYNRSSILRWANEFKTTKQIVRSLKPGSRRPAKINSINGGKLLKLITKTVSEYGLETDLWNAPRINNLSKNLKIKLSHMVIWRFLVKFKQSFKKLKNSIMNQTMPS